MKSTAVNKFLGSLALLACTSLSAAPMTTNVDVTGILSNGQTDDPTNTVLLIDIGANSTVTGFSYNVSLTAFAPSFLDEIGVVIETSARDQGFSLFLTPGDVEDGSGNMSGSGIFADMFELGEQSFAVGADGILRLEFAELFDEAVNPDGRWDFGFITFNYDTVEAEVPEPSTTLLMGAGLAMLGYAGHRRRRTTGKAAVQAA